MFKKGDRVWVSRGYYQGAGTVGDVRAIEREAGQRISVGLGEVVPVLYDDPELRLSAKNFLGYRFWKKAMVLPLEEAVQERLQICYTVSYEQAERDLSASH